MGTLADCGDGRSNTKRSRLPMPLWRAWVPPRMQGHMWRMAELWDQRGLLKRFSKTWCHLTGKKAFVGAIKTLRNIT